NGERTLAYLLFDDPVFGTDRKVLNTLLPRERAAACFCFDVRQGSHQVDFLTEAIHSYPCEALRGKVSYVLVIALDVTFPIILPLIMTVHETSAQIAFRHHQRVAQCLRIRVDRCG